MGNDYNIYKDDNFVELNIIEMSNRLNLEFHFDESIAIYVSEIMTPEEMVKIFLKGLTVCSYWMDRDKFSEMIKKHLTDAIY